MDSYLAPVMGSTSVSPEDFVTIVSASVSLAIIVIVGILAIAAIYCAITFRTELAATLGFVILTLISPTLGLIALVICCFIFLFTKNPQPAKTSAIAFVIGLVILLIVCVITGVSIGAVIGIDG